VTGLAGVGLRARRVRVPLRVPLGGSSSREAVLVEGPAGWGEFSPLPGYACDPRACEEAVREAVVVGWPAPRRSGIPVNALVPAVGPDRASELAAEAAAAGIATVKVKVGGGDPAADVDRVAAVRAALGPSGRIRLDANGAWDVETAVAMSARPAGSVGCRATTSCSGFASAVAPCRIAPAGRAGAPPTGAVAGEAAPSEGLTPTTNDAATRATTTSAGEIR